MFFIVSLLPATIFAVIGFFVVFASVRSVGTMKRFGQILGGWVLFLAGFTVLAGALAPMFGAGDFMDSMAQHMETMSRAVESQSDIPGEERRN